jgi:IS5 family transposase
MYYSRKKGDKKYVKKIKKSLNSDELLGIESDITKINDSLISSKKDTKIYSIHEPGVACIAKGKAGVKYEFGSKASIVVTKDSGIIVGAVNF